MGKSGPRRRWVRKTREPLRWVLCFGAAGLIHGYAYLHQLGLALGALAGSRPDAVSVSLVPSDRMPPALRHPAEEPGQIADAASRRPEPTLREPFGPIDAEEARKLLDEARLVDDPLATAPDTLRESIEELARRRAAQGIKDPDAAIAKADALSRGVSTESAKEIADYLGYEAADYVPRKPPPPGQFDFDDHAIYDIARARHEDGAATYRITLVDRAGRVLSYVLPPDEDPATYDNLHRIFQMAKGNPALLVVLRRMVMPMTIKFARAARQKQRAAKRPPRPDVPPPEPALKPPTAPAPKPPQPEPEDEW